MIGFIMLSGHREDEMGFWESYKTVFVELINLLDRAFGDPAFWGITAAVATVIIPAYIGKKLLDKWLK